MRTVFKTRISYWPYLFLLLFYFCIFNAPDPLTERLRSMAVCSLSPGWQTLEVFKNKILYLLVLPFSTSKTDFSPVRQELEQAQQENRLLKSQFEQVREWLLFEERIQDQYERLKTLNNADLDPLYKEFFKRRSQELCQRLELQAQSLSARVIFREPSLWSSALWIDVGEKQNEILGKKIVAKNSPVLLGTSIVGVVEYVGKTRSRVRLITDARLVPSVRTLRGKEHNLFLLEHIDAIYFALKRREDLFSSIQEASSILSMLTQLAHKLGAQAEDSYLAKGELFGCSAPLWRSRSQILKGIGFNYDFADEEGPARDLHTGKPYDPHSKKEPIALMREGDILITTGLDGVFPPGFRVACVSKVHRIKEGASSYEIEAVATAGNLDTLSHVVVLPSIDL